MLPTLDEENNLIFVDKFTPHFIRTPKRNEIIVARNPLKP